jgi:hypothetical protein
MGRPLNKKYFGNRNIGTTGAGDNGIGGESLASVSNGTVGAIQINNTYKTFPALNVTGPTIPGGVTATTQVVWEVATVTLAGGTGYSAGAITSITGLDAYGDVDTRFTVTVAGGVPTFGAFTERGSYTNIDGTGITTWAVVQGAANNTQATVTFRVKQINVTEKGSGYVTAPSLSWSAVNGGTMPSAQTPTLTVDTGNVGSATNQENAILGYAWISGALRLVDIVRQVSTKRYKVRYNGTNYIARIRYDAIADGTANYTASQGVEFNMIAIDASNGTYLVRKLYNRTATLKSIGINNSTIGITNNTAGVVFTDGKQYKWTFGTADASTVKIQNA